MTKSGYSKMRERWHIIGPHQHEALVSLASLPRTTAALAAWVGRSKKATYTTLAMLRARGMVERSRSGRWRTTEAGRAASNRASAAGRVAGLTVAETLARAPMRRLGEQ